MIFNQLKLDFQKGKVCSKTPDIITEFSKNKYVVNLDFVYTELEHLELLNLQKKKQPLEDLTTNQQNPL